jgi:sugar phosphate isomerase/epimerase
MNRLSLAHLTVLDASPPDLVTAAAGAGFQSVGIRIVPPLPGEPVFPLVADRALLRETERRLEDTGVSVLDVEAIWLLPQSRVSDFLSALEVAARLGASFLLVVGNDPDEGRLIDNFGSLCGAARSFGLKVMLEFISYCAIASLSQARALIDKAGQRNAGVLIDALHFFRMSTDPAELASTAPDALSYLQLCDAPLKAPPREQLRDEARTRRLYPGLGELPLRALLQSIPAGVPLSVEAPCAAYRSLPVERRATLAASATRRLLFECGYGS